MSELEQQLNRPRVIALAIIIGSLLLLYWLVMPVVVGSLADARGLREDQLGLLASAYSAGLAAATFASIFWIRRVAWTWLVKVGSLGAMAGFLLLLSAQSYAALLAGHIIASLFTGVAYAVTMALLGDSQQPARNYALVFFLQVVLGMGAAALLPLLADASGTLRLACQAMVLMAALCAVLGHFLPTRGSKDGRRHEGGGGKSAGRHLLPVLLGLVAIVLVFTGDSGIWVFLERIGAAGHNREFGATLVSVNLLSGAVGSLTAAWLSDRWGYLWPMVVAIGLSLVSLLLFLAESHRTALLCASFVNGWAWNFGAAYRMALVARLDSSGRYTVLIPSMQTLGNTLGPALTGVLLVRGGYPYTFSVIAGLWLAALLCYFYAWLNYQDNDKDNDNA